MPVLFGERPETMRLRYDYYLYKELLYKVASEAEAFDEYFGYRREYSGPV